MPVIDLSFVLVGRAIPLDHGYNLFSALCRVVPSLHGDRRVGVHPIRGQQTAPGVLTLTDRSRLKVRLPSEEIAPYIALAGQSLDLEGHHLRVRIPQVDALVPAANLASRLVTFRHALTPEAFEEKRQARAGPARDRGDAAIRARNPCELGRSAAPPCFADQGSKSCRVCPAPDRNDRRGIGASARGRTRRPSADGLRDVCAHEGSRWLMNPESLWAKSKRPDEPEPPSMRLSGHLADVLEAATSRFSMRPATLNFARGANRNDTAAVCGDAYCWRRRFTTSAKRITTSRT